MTTTLTCARCGGDIDAAGLVCPACGLPVERSRKRLLGKRRLWLAVVALVLLGYAIDALIDADHGKSPPHPPQMLDAPR